MSTTDQKVKEIIANLLGVSVNTVVPESHIVNELGADSLDAVEIIMDIEDKFLIQIQDDEADKVETVRQLIDIVQKKMEG